MCRSIKVLRKPGPPVTPEELHAAALQFVRKISGFTRPSQQNEELFDQAVAEGRVGVSKSIVGRMNWLGGSARLSTGPETGTEWELVLPRRGDRNGRR